MIVNLNYHPTISYGADVESYRCPPIEKLDVHGQLSLWIAFTPDSLLGHQATLFHVALFSYTPTLNESYPSPIGEPNSKDRPDKRENLSTLSTTPQFLMEPMWDRIKHKFKISYFPFKKQIIIIIIIITKYYFFFNTWH